MMWPNAQQSLWLLLTADYTTTGWNGSMSLTHAPRRHQYLIDTHIIDALCIDSHIAISIYNKERDISMAALYSYDGQHTINNTWRIVRHLLSWDRPEWFIQLEWTSFSNTWRGMIRKFLSGVPWIPFVLFNAALMLLPQTMSNIFFWLNIFGIMIMLWYFWRVMIRYFITIMFSSHYQIGSYTVTVDAESDILYLQHPTLQQLITSPTKQQHRIIIDPDGYIWRIRPINTPQTVRRNLRTSSSKQYDPTPQQRIQTWQLLMSQGIL